MTDMTDDPMRDERDLASAYLDGEATVDERARIEVDPALLAEVERMRQVRAVVAAGVEPAAISTRESQLAAALDVFDTMGASSTVAGSSLTAARSRRDRRRSSGAGGDRMRLVLGAAAGLVVLAGVGAVVRGVIVGQDTDDSAVDVAAVEDDSADEDAIGPSAADVLAEVEGENTNDELREEIDPGEVASDPSLDDVAAAESELAAAEPAEEPADEAFEEEAADTDDAAVGDTAGADAPSTPEDTPPETPLVELRSPADLADFAAPAAYAPEPPADDAMDDAESDLAGADCREERPDGLGIDRLVDAVIIADELVTVGVDLDDGIAYAFRDDCTVVLDAELPTEEEFLAANPPSVPTTQAP